MAYLRLSRPMNRNIAETDLWLGRKVLIDDNESLRCRADLDKDSFGSWIAVIEPGNVETY